MISMDPFQLEIFYDFIILYNPFSIMQIPKLSNDYCHPGLIVGMKKFFSEDLVWMITQSEKNWARQQKQNKRTEFWVKRSWIYFMFL